MIFDLITNTIGLPFIDDNMGNIVTALGLAGPKFGLLDLAKKPCSVPGSGCRFI